MSGQYLQINDSANTVYCPDKSFFIYTTENIVYLSDLTWVSATNGWGQVEIDMSNGENLPKDGEPLTIRGMSFSKGIGCHAPSQIIYTINKNYSRFTCYIGVDDEVLPAEEATGQSASVVFQIWLDGVQFFTSPVLVSSSPMQYVDIDVSNVTQLQLVVTDAGDGNAHDHADWADAKLYYK